ncbi:segregation protein B [Phaeobacter gallaeciensis]|uniref:Segregation protein B n=1 Tax=Phaeobacter gallaeciensis TaxID=60890 RepID=A0A1B0ZMU3_9RHOB|nr:MULTISPECIES: selenide, water dikinase SelD [Phaeobacter]MEE2635356.1 selenide, water dikinase SelD [Pseudomonadota bacterium]ANP35465.1 segregation protein B [Phaeobacter gallaeciensis]MDE4061988.1 selenide, water dikinase SelD [Phaeobacter gallaeciensis]MDE4125065.1 selenide, water dikinase SelD [Phaeobacter gallaeciensis]MDE4129537.1 selenide, water dikinase SelD [Phaeobacter gallaeciensis]
MDTSRLPQTKDVVLIGGGHAHALVLLKWGMRPLPGARLTLINPGPTAPYSGMLPGFVAGHYARGDLDIDLVRLARFAGARLVQGAADGLDPETRSVRVPGRPDITYDVASVDVGITSDMPNLPGFAEHGIPAKPLGSFARRWDAFRGGDGPARIAVIGGGVAGAELVLAMAHSLRSRGRLEQATLIDSGPVLGTASAGIRERLRRAFSEQGVTVVENTAVNRIHSSHIELEGGREVLSGFTTGAAGARPHDWLADTGLEVQDGFLTVSDSLQTSDPQVFAAGDCAHLAYAPRPKAGVYAVRQAPVLLHNLRAAITGDPMRHYRPQKDYLKLISMGAKEALGERFGTQFSGPMIWRWKDRIDQNFMEQFRSLPEMEVPDLPPEHTLDLPAVLGDKPMCGGCGAKAGRAALHAAGVSRVASLREDVTALPGDDAALLTMGDVRQVISTDHLRAFSLDPFVMARIAAVHALGDIWAMGAAPQAATANLILPRLAPALQQRTLIEIMTAARSVMEDAGAEIIGGHTSLGDELTVGFTVTGLCNQDPVTLAGAQPGDALVLTKPLGSGVIMAAEMAGKAEGAWVTAALEQMAQPQAAASRILAPEAHAMTDVTGFGLAGHLLGICEASGVSAEIDFAAVPLMEGAAQLADSGIRSSLFPENAALLPEWLTSGAQDLLFDPQTAGGLLAALPQDKADGVLQQLKEAGYPAAIIGKITQGAGQIVLT